MPHILVAEDSRPAREHLVSILQALDRVQLSQVQNGAEAITFVERAQPDLVLCDYTMPILDGLQVLKLLRRKWSAAQLPILMLTGSHSVNDKVAAFGFGANDYVTKPAHPEELLARVKAQLALKAAVEENQLARDRLLQASRLQTVGRLAAGLAHEMNTPAQYVSDNLHFLSRALPGVRDVLGLVEASLQENRPMSEEVGSKIKETWKKQRVSFVLEQIPAALQHSAEGIGRIAALIAELKAFTGADSQEVCAAADINEAIQNTVNVSRGEWQSTARITLDLDAGLPLVPCRVAELKQVLLNLIYNAVQAFGGEFGAPARGGQIEIVSRCLPTVVEVSVSDDGPGIDPAIRDRVFEPFFTTKRVGGGMGQGLAVGYDVVVNRHGGTLTCEESALGGACFRLSVPKTSGPRVAT